MFAKAFDSEKLRQDDSANRVVSNDGPTALHDVEDGEQHEDGEQVDREDTRDGMPERVVRQKRKEDRQIGNHGAQREGPGIEHTAAPLRGDQRQYGGDMAGRKRHELLPENLITRPRGDYSPVLTENFTTSHRRHGT